MAVHSSDALREFLADGDFNPKQAARLALLVEGIVSDNDHKIRFDSFCCRWCAVYPVASVPLIQKEKA